MPGGSQTCADCGETFNGGTDLSKYGCRCRKAMYTAAKANKAALNDQQPEAPSDGQPIGGRVQCEHCWGFYNKGTNLRLYGCPCQKAKLEAVFAEPQAESKSEGGYCDDLQCSNPSPCSIHQSSASDCPEASFDGYTVYYWSGFSARAQPLIAMLIVAGAKWQRITDASKENHLFEVPTVRKGKFALSQTGALAAYLGEELGFNHPPALRHVAAMLVDDLVEIWTEVYQKRSKAANWGEVDEFVQGRLADWFATLDNAAAKFGSPGFFLGDKTTYLDFVLWTVVETIDFCYGAARLAKLFSYAPRMKAIHAAMAANPRVAAYAKEESVLYPGAKYDAAMPMKD